jgi:hypothetical protein
MRKESCCQAKQKSKRIPKWHHGTQHLRQRLHRPDVHCILEPADSGWTNNATAISLPVIVPATTTAATSRTWTPTALTMHPRPKFSRRQSWISRTKSSLSRVIRRK